MVKAVKNIVSSGVTTMVPGANAAPIGPYTSGKIIKGVDGTWGYTAGQIARHPKTGLLVHPKKPSG